MNIYEGLESLSFCIMTEQVKKPYAKIPEMLRPFLISLIN
jgi:hypothetical protein